MKMPNQDSLRRVAFVTSFRSNGMNWLFMNDLIVAQTFLSAGSRDILVPCFWRQATGDWKVPRTRRLESLRYIAVYGPDVRC